MKVVYTKKPHNEPGVIVRDPDYFYGVIAGATSVVVDGDYPSIQKAYRDAGIGKPAKTASSDGGAASTKGLTVPEIKDALAAKGVEIPADVTKKADLLALLEGTE